MLRGGAARFAGDWSHHAVGVSRLNHGSFGSAPRPVLEAMTAARAAWLAQPDEMYFTGDLEARLGQSCAACARALNSRETVLLVENSTVASAIIAQRWRGKGKALVLSVAYGGVVRCLETILGRDRVVVADVPFPGTTRDSILEGLRRGLEDEDVEFAMLDHISSQPAIDLPVAEMVELCRSKGVAEIAIDGAHGLGQVESLDVPSLGADWYFTNVHKWAFAPPTATVLWGRTDELLLETPHVVPSWQAHDGLVASSKWSGTRDYSGFIAVDAAMQYLRTWRSMQGLDSIAYNRAGLAAALADIKTAWRVDPAYDEDDCLPGAMAMIRLPPNLDLAHDLPGQPGSKESVRAKLRDRYQVEAAVGGFRLPDTGHVQGFLRLSHAVYNTDEDFDRLKDAVLDLAQPTPGFISLQSS